MRKFNKHPPPKRSGSPLEASGQSPTQHQMVCADVQVRSPAKFVRAVRRTESGTFFVDPSEKARPGTRFTSLNLDTGPGIRRIRLVLEHAAESCHRRPSVWLRLPSAWPSLGNHGRPSDGSIIRHVADDELCRYLPANPFRGESCIQETPSPVAPGYIALRRRGERCARWYALTTVALGSARRYDVASHFAPSAAQSFR